MKCLPYQIGEYSGRWGPAKWQVNGYKNSTGNFEVIIHFYAIIHTKVVISITNVYASFWDLPNQLASTQCHHVQLSKCDGKLQVCDLLQIFLHDLAYSASSCKKFENLYFRDQYLHKFTPLSTQ